MQYPVWAPGENSAQDERTAMFQQLGESLRKHPDAARELLKARDREESSSGRPVQFAEAVFRFAGKELLPVLHKALESSDRVVRSNAARGCGAIGDPSSIPHLIAALDLESGLSRASVVWALGRLKAKQALPQLGNLYVDAVNDDRRRKGAGFRYAQFGADMSAQYDSIRSLEALSGDWDQLKSATQPFQPVKSERLLSTAGILDAVRSIGPDVSQDFYRLLATGKDSSARYEAVEQLAQCGADDAAKNIPILRNLLGDKESSVRLSAAVSLLVLGRDEGQGEILGRLASSERRERQGAVQQLKRVTDHKRLAFARDRLQALAADPLLSDELRAQVQNLLAGSL
jgi:HEAT repeat protein